MKRVVSNQPSQAVNRNDARRIGVLCARRVVILPGLAIIGCLSFFTLSWRERQHRHPFSPGLGRSRLRRHFQKCEGLAHVRDGALVAGAVHCAEVDRTHRADRVDAPVGHGRVDGIAAARADSKYTNPLLVDESLRGQIVDGSANILDTSVRVFLLPGLAAARALIGRVVGERDEALFRQLRGIEPGRLFLDTARRMNDDDCYVAAIFREIFREVDCQPS
jgi:hypothetical protein